MKRFSILVGITFVIAAVVSGMHMTDKTHAAEIRAGQTVGAGESDPIHALFTNTVATNITIVGSNAVNVIRIGNNYIIHAPTNDAAAASVQNIQALIAFSGTAQPMADSTDVVVTFSNEIVNVGGHWDSATHQFDVPVAGNYAMYAQVLWQGTLTANANYIIRIKTNNNQTVAQFNSPAGNNLSKSMGVYIELPLTTNHSVEVTAQGDGSSDEISGNFRLSYFLTRLLRED